MKKPVISMKTVRACRDIQTLTKVFEKAKITKSSEKEKILREAMRNPAISFATTWPPQKERLEIITSAFLSRVWR